jgi:hypothetical protein
MNKNTKIIWFLVLVVIVVIIFSLVQAHTAVAPNPETTTKNEPVVTCLDPNQIYTNNLFHFSLCLPPGYAVNQYAYQELGPDQDILGMKFTIPKETAAGTNLSGDSYFSVEGIPSTPTCSASLFLDTGAKVSTVTDNGVNYSKGILNGAAAGNRYDETVYALPGTNPCLAIRYFIHYGVIDNYPAGMVKEFDETTLVSQFDKIRETLVVKQ